MPSTLHTSRAQFDQSQPWYNANIGLIRSLLPTMYQGKRDFFSKGYYKRRKRKRCRAYSTFWNALFKFMIIYNMICVQTQSTYSFVPKSNLDETIDHISSSSHSTILSRQYDSSSSVLSYGSIFVLELKQPNVQLTINSIDIIFKMYKYD